MQLWWWCALCVACRLELEQERKWVVESHVNQQELVVTVTDPKQSVYIYNCSGSVVQVQLGRECVLWTQTSFLDDTHPVAAL